MAANLCGRRGNISSGPPRRPAGFPDIGNSGLTDGSGSTTNGPLSSGLTLACGGWRRRAAATALAVRGPPGDHDGFCPNPMRPNLKKAITSVSYSSRVADYAFFRDVCVDDSGHDTRLGAENCCLAVIYSEDSVASLLIFPVLLLRCYFSRPDMEAEDSAPDSGHPAVSLRQ